MPIAHEIWIEQIKPGEARSIVASFELSKQCDGDPAALGLPFMIAIEGIGDVVFSFVCCLKGRSIYSASLEGLVSAPTQIPERAELLCSELLMASPLFSP